MLSAFTKGLIVDACYVGNFGDMVTGMPSELVRTEETLDPSDWNEMRGLAHRMVDDMFAFLQSARERPVWRPMPDSIQRRFEASLPFRGESAEKVYEEFRSVILPYPLGNLHPRFWGWVMGNGTPMGMMADMLASGMNSNLGGLNHAAILVERQVIDWCKEIFSYPRDASGLLVSGGSMANLVGLAVARSAKAGFDVHESGLSSDHKTFTLYGSEEMHSSLVRAVELLGLGSKQLRRVPVDEEYRVDVSALQRAIEADLGEGLQPICIIGNAGTVNTGATDPLDKLSEVAARYGLWFHVDGAFGSLAYLSPELRSILAGMERADSIAFDLHKWGYLPFEVGCILVRDAEVHRATFAFEAEYLKHANRGMTASAVRYRDYGLQLTRGFRALKVWMTFKMEGVEKLGRVIRQNVAQAAYLAKLVSESAQLELLAPVPLNVVCFRFKASGLDEARLNDLNEELLIRLQASGVAILSGTNLHDRYALRCAITNHRSRREDFEMLVSEVERIGNTLLQEASLGKSS